MTNLVHPIEAGAVNASSRCKPRGHQVPSIFRGGKRLKLVGQGLCVRVTIRPCYVGRDHSVVPDTRHHWLDGLAGLSGYGSGAALHRLYELCTSCPERTINIGSVACKGARCEMCAKIVVIVVAQIRRPLMPILKGKGKSPRQFIKGPRRFIKGPRRFIKGLRQFIRGFRELKETDSSVRHGNSMHICIDQTQKCAQ
jgi:hypothetical protein